MLITSLFLTFLSFPHTLYQTYSHASFRLQNNFEATINIAEERKPAVFPAHIYKLDHSVWFLLYYQYQPLRIHDSPESNDIT